MDKCWFVLRQSHYPPPEYSEAKDSSRGAICLGHIIPDLRHLDQIINVDGPEPYPPNMPVHPTKKWSLDWESDRDRHVTLSAKGGAPAGPVQAQAAAAIAFKRFAGNHWNFESLDTSIIQPTLAYIEDSVESEPVRSFLDGKKSLGFGSWTLFMITGLVIARGAAHKQHDATEASAHSQGGAKGPGGIEAAAEASVSSKDEEVRSYQRASDFVWAVRLTKVSKMPLHPGLKRETVVKGATFTLGEQDEVPIKIMEELAADGLDPGDVTSFGGDKGIIFFVPNSANTDDPGI